MATIDSHVHFWNYHPVRDAWITDEMSALQHDFLPEGLQPLLQENKVDGCVAVQADQSEAETNFLVSLAQKSSIIKGVVGWINLRADDVDERLGLYARQKIIKGWRHIVQAEPEGFLLDEKFLRGIGFLAKFDYTYDVLIFPPQMGEALEFIEKFPGQSMVIDHCAKPDIKNNHTAQWAQKIKQLATNKNLYCKLSGLITEAAWNNWTEKQIFGVLDVVFGAFGTDRLMFGSDWPVMNLSGNYQSWKKCLEKYLEQFSAAERENVLGENCIRFYRL